MPEPDSLNVQALMEDIKRRVKERIARGEFTEEDIRKVEEAELSIPPNIEDLLDEMTSLAQTFESLVAPLNDLWVPHQPLPQPGLKGRVLTFIQKLFSPLARILFATQAKFNAQVVQSMNELKVYIARIFDLTSNLSYRHYLAKFQRNLDEISDTQRRMFRLLLRAMEQHRHLRRDMKYLRETAMLTRAQGVLTTPAEPSGFSQKEEKAESGDALYLAFEDLHRGSREEIMKRQKGYLPHFRTCRKVLDIGCGRGEFLELLKESDVEGIGIDINPVMVQHCRDRGLNARQGDALAHLSEVPEGFYDGIFCAQMVEHLTWPQVLSLLRLSFGKLAEGGKLVVETINPQCLTTFSGLFYLDPTHVKPVHPLTLQFACQAIGFHSAEIIYASPIPDEMKLQEVDFFRRTGDISDKFVNVLNNNVLQLNELLYAPQDYALLAIKGETPPR